MKYIIPLLCIMILVGCGESLQEKTLPTQTQNSPPSSGDLPASNGKEEQDALLPSLLKGEAEGFITQNNEPDVLLPPLLKKRGPGGKVALSPDTLSTHTNHLISLQTDIPEDILYVTI